MSRRNFNLKLDLFPGFYETILENSDTAYYAIKDHFEYYHDEMGEDINENDLDFDNQAYERDVCEAFVEAYKQFTPDIVLDLTYESMTSPREYNFRTDELFCDFKLAPNWISEMRKFMKENYEWLEERISEDWSPYDGFWSFMSNRIDEWYDNLFKEFDERYIGAMITYMMWREYINKHPHANGQDLRFAICEYTLDDIYNGRYVYNVKEREAEANS